MCNVHIVNPVMIGNVQVIHAGNVHIRQTYIHINSGTDAA